MPSASSTTPSRPSTPVLLAVLALVFVLGVGWILHGQRQTEAAHAALEELEAHSAQFTRLDALLLQVLQAESGARAYVLSGDEHYLSAYIDGRAQAGDTLAALRTGFAADPGALAAVDALAEPVERRWLSLDQLVAGRGSGSVEAATLIAGSAITTDIRARIEALRAPLRTRMEGITRASFERSGQARGINSVLGVAIIALLLVIGGLAWRQEELRGRITALLRTENARLQAEVDARTAELTSLAGYLSETREAEHARLAAELHDEFGPLLSAVRMDAVWITRKLPAEALEPVRGRFDHLLDTLGRVVSSKRRIVAGLKPPLLADLGLAEALRSLIAEMQDLKGAEVVFDAPEALPPLAQPVALALYRIAQEAIDNARRHAGAQRIAVTLAPAGEEILIGVSDDGAGFDPAQVRAKGHGLAGLALRARLLGGRLEIDSARGRGTRIEARVPLQPAG